MISKIFEFNQELATKIKQGPLILPSQATWLPNRLPILHFVLILLFEQNKNRFSKIHNNKNFSSQLDWSWFPHFCSAHGRRLSLDQQMNGNPSGRHLFPDKMHARTGCFSWPDQ